MLSFATRAAHNGDEATKTIGDPKDANFPVDGEGRVYHLGLKYGERTISLRP